MTRSWSTVACALAVSCGHPAAPPAIAPPAAPVDAAAPASDASTKVGVALHISPPDAEVLIDGSSYGKASGLDPVVELKPGLYTLLVAREGYQSYRVEFSVTDKTESFVVRLEPSK